MLSIASNGIGFYNSLIEDYINNALIEKGIVDWEYSQEALFQRALEVQKSEESRALLVDAFERQLTGLELSASQLENINALKFATTSTITTGHQLNFLGGSTFFYSKILDVVKLCRIVEANTQRKVVPVFWMATEDHDFKEIAQLTIFGKKIVQEGETKGPVGRISVEAIQGFLEELKGILGNDPKMEVVNRLLNQAYQPDFTLAQATKTLVHELFKEDGVLIIDGDDWLLKKAMIPYFIKEVNEQVAFHSVNKQLTKFDQYKIQVNPREINLFYIENDIRERIEVIGDTVKVVNSILEWSAAEFLSFVNENPEKISPNVLLRPLYQEVLLPNIAYVGGAGEIAYWLELTEMFKAFQIKMPMPIIRTSYFFLAEKQYQILVDQSLSFKDVFQDRDQVLKGLVKEVSDLELNLNDEKLQLEAFFKTLLEKAMQVDNQMDKTILGEEKRSMSALENIEKKLVNAEKRKHEVLLNRVNSVFEKLKPGGVPMERVESFLPLLTNPNFNLKTSLLNKPNPLEKTVELVLIN